MTYTKQTWSNSPSTASPMSAERLNHMEDGIGAAQLTDNMIQQILNDPAKYCSAAVVYSLAQTVQGLSDKQALNNVYGTTPTNMLLIGGEYNNRTVMNNSGVEYVGGPISGTMLGVREVYIISGSHFLVKIIEAYPVVGRTWYNFYNVNAWSGWKSVTPV